MKNGKAKHIAAKYFITIFISTIIFIIHLFCFLQRTYAHRLWQSAPDREIVDISELLEKEALSEDDYALLFLQTGLGKQAVDHFFAQNKKEEIFSYQEYYFAERSIVCESIVGWVTKSDYLADNSGQKMFGTPFADIRPGDILISLSSHSVGWLHGHAAIVIDSETVLQSTCIGGLSEFAPLDTWRTHSNYTVLRVKNDDGALGEAAADFAKEHLIDVPYDLFSGIFFQKNQNSKNFGAQCAYLVWYAWDRVGVDIDGNGGMVVAPEDILQSPQLEIVQSYGIDFAD